MQLTIVKSSALFVLRSLRAVHASPNRLARRTVPCDPNPAPRQRWTQSNLTISLGKARLTPSADRPLDVLVSAQGKRLGSRLACNTIRSMSTAPHGYIPIGNGLRISCPELLFIELANSLSPAEHLLLGFELCGRFSRDAEQPIDGDATLDIPPATSVDKLHRYMTQARDVDGLKNARRTLRLLSDNAWSPAEAVVATMMALPLKEFGYGLGPSDLNVRVPTPEHLSVAAQADSRVPDILLRGTSVGVNYDGTGHLELDAISQAALELGANLGSKKAQYELDRAMESVRAKAVDDVRRNRELSADGLHVVPIVKEDLYESGGLDRSMLQVTELLERYAHRDCREIRIALQSAFAAKKRHRLLLSMLPGNRTVHLNGAQEEAFVRL